jgi:biotin transport system substrate-specific component
MHSLTFRRINTSVWLRVLGVALFAVATGLSARLRVVLPFSPVAITLQVLAVVLCGLVLGPRDGLIAQLLYLQSILLGVPWTSTGLAGPVAFVSPTAGYLIAFPLAAAAAGWLSHRSSEMKPLWRAIGAISAIIVIYTLGTAWLSAFVGGLSNAWRLGVAPFVLVDLFKATIAVAALSLRDR